MPLYLTRFSYTPATWAKLIKTPRTAERRPSSTSKRLAGNLIAAISEITFAPLVSFIGA